MRKMSRVVEKVNGHVAGLDVHKNQITYCVLDRKGCEVAAGQFLATRERLGGFLAEYVGRKTFHFALEASGYSLWVYDLLCASHGQEKVHVAHAAHVRLITHSTKKNDDNDAYWLAYLTHEGRLPEAALPEGSLRELRLATRFRIRAVRRRTSLIVQIRSQLSQVGMQVRKGLDSIEGRERVDAILLDGDLTATRAECIRDSLAQMDEQDRLIAKWARRVKELAASLPAIATLQHEMPGFGPTLAPAIYAETGDPRRFASAKQLGGYTGLVPRDRSSGGKTRHGRMTKAGSPFLRWALVQAVIACQRAKRGPALAIGNWVRRMQARTGDKKRAQCAAARKLAEAMWRLFEYGERFDVARAFGG